jgi:glycosyltransferase involved in cell wall biosynthesis
MSLKIWSESGLVGRDTLLYTHLIEQGFRVVLVTYGGPDDRDYLPAGSTIEVLSKPSHLSNSSYGRNIVSIHRSALQRADVIKSHQVDGARYGVLASVRLGKPYVAGAVISRLCFTRAVLLHSAHAFLPLAKSFSPSTTLTPARCQAGLRSNTSTGRYRVRRSKLHACPNWIDPTRFAPDPRVAKHPRRICFVARFEPQKDPLACGGGSRGLKDVELLMIGSGSMKGAIEAKAREYGVTLRIMDQQPNEALPALLNSATAYVLPTRFEGGSPKTLLEAMACGVPS